MIYVIFEFVLLRITKIYLTKHHAFTFEILSEKNPHNLPHKSDKTNGTRRQIAADNVLSLRKNIANVFLVIKIDVT